ncbi:hypothetical protein EON80_09195 [bacterium]|nr:MAG: hypothetical protein EON80_09195 [bacterium]
MTVPHFARTGHSMLASSEDSHIVMPILRKFPKFVLIFGLTISLPAPIFAAPLSFLSTESTHVVDQLHQPVELRGPNLGGWLLEEMWMSPFITKPPTGSPHRPIKDAAGLWKTIEARFGRDEAYHLKKDWRDAWLGESDFVRIKAAGFNCVRLPFIYDAQNDPDGLLFWLDRAVGWAEKAGIYVILDMHGAPGRQSKGDITGEADIDRLFKEPRYVEETAALWQKIARRYRGRSNVAAYDLLNEPMGAPNPTTLHLVHERLYRAIREVDERHIVIVEDGYKGFDSLPYPAALGWKNVMLSLHSYDFDAKNAQAHRRQVDGLVSEVASKLNARHVPFYLGEFNIEPYGNPETLNYFVKALQRRGYSWSFWTYKVAGLPGGRSVWGWYHVPNGFKPIDPFNDSSAQMREKFTQFRTPNMVEYQELKEALGAPTFSRLAIEKWDFRKSASGVDPSTEDLSAKGDWRGVEIGEDVFDAKPGFGWFKSVLPPVVATEKTLLFDSADDNATVYFNGHRLTKHEGWTGAFEASLDEFWKADGPNEVAVLVENTAQGGGLTGKVNLALVPAGK